MPEYLNAAYEGDDLYTGDQLRKAILDEREAICRFLKSIDLKEMMNDHLLLKYTVDLILILTETIKEGVPHE